VFDGVEVRGVVGEEHEFDPGGLRKGQQGGRWKDALSRTVTLPLGSAGSSISLK